jgi:hypothetical protein
VPFGQEMHYFLLKSGESAGQGFLGLEILAF